MKKPDAADLLDVLACELGVRPKNAPTFEDVASYIVDVLRDDAAITIRFQAAALEQVIGLVDAERLCCADLVWEIVREPNLALRIGASPGQLDVLQQMLAARA